MNLWFFNDSQINNGSFYNGQMKKIIDRWFFTLALGSRNNVNSGFHIAIKANVEENNLSW